MYVHVHSLGLVTSPETLVVVRLSQEKTGLPGLGTSTSGKVNQSEQMYVSLAQLHMCTQPKHVEMYYKTWLTYAMYVPLSVRSRSLHG